MRIKRGFTLVESLVSLSILSILLILSLPYLRRSNLAKYEVQTLKLLFESAHRQSIEERKDVYVSTSNNSLYIDDNMYLLNSCSIENSDLIFLKSGASSRSFTLNIECYGASYSLVIHLGSGHVAIN